MAIGSRRLGSVPIMLMSTKRSRNYSTMPSRYPAAPAMSRGYKSRVENDLSDRVSNASYISNYALDEGYDTAKKSRGRDEQLLREATNAIVSSESYATPQSSVATRRVLRGRSMVPRATSVPARSLYPEAAIISCKGDVDTFRRPRSEYAARKYRSMHRDAQEGIYSHTPRSSVGLYASNPPLPKMTERKAIRTDDGYSQPKNLLSWQYRLESKMSPNDLMYTPTSFGRIRHQVREAQEKMDVHRQMLDRYLPEEGADSSDAAARVLRKMDREKRDTIGGCSGQT